MDFTLPKIRTDLTSFSTEFPDVINNQTDGNRQYSINKEVSGLSGSWVYDFKDNKLNRYNFDSYSDEINQANFDKYLTVKQDIIENFKRQFGEPTELEFENEIFKDPYVERHWGYDVISAIWRTPEMDFRVQFHFIGSHRDYNFIFSMNFHHAGYEYF